MGRCAPPDRPPEHKKTTASSRPSFRNSWSVKTPPTGRPASVQPRQPLKAPGRIRSRPVGHGGVRTAEGAPLNRATAQAEPCRLRISARPAALVPTDRDQGRQTGLGDPLRRVLDGLRRRPSGRRRSSRSADQRTGRLLSRGAPGRKPHPVDLAEDCAAGDAVAEITGDLFGGSPLQPEGLQTTNAVFGPDGGGHGGSPCQQAGSARPPSPFPVLFRIRRKRPAACATGRCRFHSPVRTGCRRSDRNRRPAPGPDGWRRPLRRRRTVRAGFSAGCRQR